MASRGQGVDLVPIYRLLPEARRGAGAIMIMRDATYRMLLRVGAVNFDMRSPVEQNSITYSFGELLSGLTPDFPIQIFSHTKLLDAEAYLRQFSDRLADPSTPPAIQALIKDHIAHVRAQILSRNLLQREFYVVITYGDVGEAIGTGAIESMPGVNVARAFFSLVERRVLRTPDQLDVDVATGQLDMRAAQVQGALERMEIPSSRLGEQELLGLLRELFNPGQADRRTLGNLSAVDQIMPALPARSSVRTSEMHGAPPLDRPAL